MDYLQYSVHPPDSTIMASSSSSSSFSSSTITTTSLTSQPCKYDVFLNFRGEDTRRNFISHLYAALCQKDLQTFFDDDELKKGEEIAQSLPQAIKDSTIAVIVFSKNYAYSSWCLDELVEIIKCRRTRRQIVIPIFYEINPSHLRKQSDDVAAAFVKHEQNIKNAHKTQGWRDALTTVANLCGFDSKDFRNDHMLINKIVEDVLEKLDQFMTWDGYENLVGMDSHIKQIKKVCTITPLEVCVLGIWGMGGTDKTTIAEVIYQFQSRYFDQRIETALTITEEVCRKKEKEVLELQETLQKTTHEVTQLQTTIDFLRSQLQSNTPSISHATKPEKPKTPTPGSIPLVTPQQFTPNSAIAQKKQDELESKVYVIYNGPMSSIYDKWHKAALHVTGKKGILYKSFSTCSEAEKSLTEFRNPPLRSQYSQVLQITSPSQSHMKNLGKPIDLDRINLLPSKAIQKDARRLTSEMFIECFQALNLWTEEMKMFQYYPQNRGRFGPKAVIFPGADPLSTYLFFQSGLIDTIYLINISIISYFPIGFIQAVKTYKDRFAKEREIFIKIYSSYPIFKETEGAKSITDAELKLSRIAYLQIGISNGIYPPIDTPTQYEYNWDTINQFNLHCLKGVFNQCNRITNESMLKINYKGPNMIMVSAYRSPIKADAIQIIQQFSQPFGHMDGPFEALSISWKQAICKQLRDYEEHRCLYCQPQEITPNKDEDAGSDEVIIEDN